MEDFTKALMKKIKEKEDKGKKMAGRLIKEENKG